jgi:hypothetical protein
MAGKIVTNRLRILSVVVFNPVAWVWMRRSEITGLALHSTKGWRSVGKKKVLVERSKTAKRPADWKSGIRIEDRKAS